MGAVSITWIQRVFRLNKVTGWLGPPSFAISVVILVAHGEKRNNQRDQRMPCVSSHLFSLPQEDVYIHPGWPVFRTTVPTIQCKRVGKRICFYKHNRLWITVSLPTSISVIRVIVKARWPWQIGGTEFVEMMWPPDQLALQPEDKKRSCKLSSLCRNAIISSFLSECQGSGFIHKKIEELSAFLQRW